MIDFRLYRPAFGPFLATVVVLLFSLQAIPVALFPAAPPTAFDAESAARTAHQIVEEAPVREPGSAGDTRIADLVLERFKGVKAGEVSEQTHESSFEGDEVELRNVLLTLTGDSERVIALVAARDSAAGPGAATSASATAALLELAGDLGAARHTKTIVVVSTSGGSDGATGMREFLEGYPGRELIESVVVITQPGAGDEHDPSVIATSGEDHSSALQLVRTAQRTLADQADTRRDEQGTVGQLLRLALPIGLGEQAVAIDAGAEAVAISGAGERLLDPAEDEPRDISAATLGSTGRAVLATVLALDAAAAPPEHGPDSYLTLAGSVIPGWALAMVALALLLPPAVAAIDGLARAARMQAAPTAALAWPLRLALPLLATLALVYLLALLGILPRPRAPFEPGRFDIGALEIVAMAFLVIAFGAALRFLPGRPAGAPPVALAPAVGLVATACVLAVWLVNPFLALLVLPLAHAWLVGVNREPARRSPAGAVAVLVALVPATAAFVYVGAQLELGAAAPWRYLLMVTSGQIPFAICLMLAVLAACAASMVVAALRAAPRTDHS